MRVNRTLVGAVAIAGAAFVIGQLAGPLAAPMAAAQDGGGQEYSPDEIARMKAATPGRQHEVLERLVGKWQGVIHMIMAPGGATMSAETTITREWVLDKHFLREKIESDTEWGNFEGLGYLGYNNVDGQYESTWMENMATSINFSTGWFDPDREVLVLKGSHRDPSSGRVVSEWGELDLSSPGRQVYTGWSIDPDGRRYKNFEGEFDRVK